MWMLKLILMQAGVTLNKYQGRTSKTSDGLSHVGKITYVLSSKMHEEKILFAKKVYSNPICVLMSIQAPLSLDPKDNAHV